eukprot:jgi/Chlat1/8042/Chrsp73S07517
MEEIEALLKAPDAITETTILELLGRYIAAGGEPQRAVQFLSEGYRGYAQMTQLVCEWLHLVNSDGDSSTAGVNDETEINRAAAAAQGYLSQLVMDNFNPRVADTVFSTAKTSRPPAWLDFLVHDAEGRKLVYALAESTQERHMGTCLLLNFAIQTIWKQGLFESSSSSTPNNSNTLSPPAPAVAAAYFGVYHRVLLDRLDALHGVGENQYNDEASGLAASKQFADVRALACHSQYTYLYAQMLLLELASLPGGRAYRRVAQELEAAAVVEAADNTTNNNNHHQKGRGAAARRLTALLLPAGRATSENLEAAQCVADMLQEGATVLGDMRRLHRLYFPPSNPTSSTPSPNPAPPSAELLRHPSFLSLLLGDLFNPRKQGGAGGGGVGGTGGGGGGVNPAYRDEYLHVLAYAACAKDDRERGGGVDTDEVDRTVVALSTALKIVELAASGTRPRAGGTVGDPVQALQVPVAAMGVLHWVVVHLKDNNYYKSINQYAATPVYLELIEMIAPLQPRQHGMILDVLMQGLKIAGSELGATAVAELKKRFIDALVVLVRSGCIDPALASVKRWVRQSTSGRIHDLARYFVVQLLDAVAPPFSRAFAGHVLDLVAAIRGDAFCSGPGVRDFALFCRDASFDPPLDDDRTAAVTQLLEGVK